MSEKAPSAIEMLYAEIAARDAELFKQSVEIVRVRERAEQAERERDEAITLLGHLYWWVHDLPIKHPQQAEWRSQARDVLDRAHEQSPRQEGT